MAENENCGENGRACRHPRSIERVVAVTQSRVWGVGQGAAAASMPACVRRLAVTSITSNHPRALMRSHSR